jgi:hypothetical protein
MGQSIDKFLVVVTKVKGPNDDEKKRNQILKRQRKLEKAEVSQTWRFVFGDQMPQHRKDVFKVECVTPRNVWMEGRFFLFEEIIKHRTDEFFHKPQDYALKWQPPNSPYRLIIPLDDPLVQENVIITMSKLGTRARSQILFYFSPKDPSMSLYAPRVHPSSLVSYHSKNAVLKKLCDFYLDGKLKLEELHHIMTCGYDTWKLSMFHLLPADEQVYHRYLLEKPPEVAATESLGKKYLDDEISLAEYADKKFPERKKMKDIEAMTYPLPYEAVDCVVCGVANIATIKCQNCDNMVCKACITTRFLDPETKDGSFVYMHRR